MMSSLSKEEYEEDLDIGLGLKQAYSAYFRVGQFNCTVKQIYKRMYVTMFTACIRHTGASETWTVDRVCRPTGHPAIAVSLDSAVAVGTA